MMESMLPMLAEGGPLFQHLGDKFRPAGSNYNWLPPAAAAFALVAFAGLIWLGIVWSRKRERRAFFSPKHLFRELCRVHHLSWSDRRLLQLVARRSRLTEAADVFVEPRYLIAAEEDAALHARRPRLRLLSARIFGTEATLT